MKFRFDKTLMIRSVALFLAYLVLAVTSIALSIPKAESEVQEQPKIRYEEYMIESVPVLNQDELKAGCEIYACTVVLKYLGFDITEKEFADNYLIAKPITYVEDYYRYGPDMHSAYAGDAYEGYGIYAPAMAKSMNNYLKAMKSDLKAYDLKDVEFDSLCDDYVVKNIPVMVWATTYMLEPYVKAQWTIDYVDENAESEIGETEEWFQNEHCLVLIGFDKENYYFCDSVYGKITAYEKEIVKTRYAQLFSQAIVVK